MRQTENGLVTKGIRNVLNQLCLRSAEKKSPCQGTQLLVFLVRARTTLPGKSQGNESDKSR